MPVYNDWQSAYEIGDLVLDILEEYDELNLEEIVLVNDYSPLPELGPKAFDYKVIDLNRNVGHQSSIAIGLSYVRDNLESKQSSFYIVMDSDGEDNPAHIINLYKKAVSNEGKIIFVSRSKRSEGLKFTFFYKAYKFFFKILTGKNITFGNFSLIPKHYISNVSSNPDIWNHFSGSIIKSKIPYTSIFLPRGKRLYGKTKMNFTNLVIHGLSSIAVHIETTIVRLLIAISLIVLILIILLLIVIFVRLNTDIAIPGWATYSVLGLLAILSQLFLTVLVLTFSILNYKSQKLFFSPDNYKNLIIKTYEVRRKRT